VFVTTAAAAARNLPASDATALPMSVSKRTVEQMRFQSFRARSTSHNGSVTTMTSHQRLPSIGNQCRRKD